MDTSLVLRYEHCSDFALWSPDLQLNLYLLFVEALPEQLAHMTSLMTWLRRTSNPTLACKTIVGYWRNKSGLCSYPVADGDENEAADSGPAASWEEAVGSPETSSHAHQEHESSSMQNTDTQVQ